MNKINILSIVVAVFFIFPASAFAQLDINSNISLPQLDNPPSCHVFIITGNQGWTPFAIKFFYPSTHGGKLEWEKTLPESKPFTQTTDQALYFFTNSTDPRWIINATVDWDTPKLRGVYIEYWSQGSMSHSETIPVEGTHFCALYNVATSPAPHIPTAQELLGQKVYDALNDIPQITPAINGNTIAINQAFWVFAGGLLFSLIISGSQTFAILTNRRTSRKKDKLELQKTEQQLLVLSKTDEMLNKVDTVLSDVQSKSTQILDSKLAQIENSVKTIVVDTNNIMKGVMKILSDAMSEYQDNANEFSTENFRDAIYEKIPEPKKIEPEINTIQLQESDDKHRMVEIESETESVKEKKDVDMTDVEAKSFKNRAMGIPVEIIHKIMKSMSQSKTLKTKKQLKIFEEVLDIKKKEEADRDKKDRELEEMAEKSLIKMPTLMEEYRPHPLSVEQYNVMDYEDLMKEYERKRTYQDANPSDTINNHDVDVIRGVLISMADEMKKEEERIRDGFGDGGSV